MMAWFDRLVDELPKAVVEIPVGAIGFFIALWINQRIERLREQTTFQSMLVALRAEARANEDVRTKGFNTFLPMPDGIVLREFRVATAQALLANPLAMKYLADAEVESLNAYVTNLALANSYRRALEINAIPWTTKSQASLDNVKDFLVPHLELVRQSIETIYNFRLDG